MTKVKWLIKWERFWRLTALWECERRPVWNKWAHHRYEKCVCDCWNICWANKYSIKKWHTNSCWCLWKENIERNVAMAKKHWDRNSRFYTIFYWIKQRCNNPKNSAYKNYWWRWIGCERELYEDFKNDMFDSYCEHINIYWDINTTIDRIDTNWNYCKDNCKRATKKEQQRNVRRNRLFDWDWELLTIWEICEKSWTDIKYSTIIYRVYVCWWDIKDAVTKPLVHWRTNFNNINKE